MEFKKELAVSTTCISADSSAEICNKSKRHSKNNRSLNASSHTATTGTSAQSLSTKDILETTESSVPVEIKKEKRKSKRRSTKDGSHLKETAAAIAKEARSEEEDDGLDRRCHDERSKGFATRVSSSRKKSGAGPIFIPNDSIMNLMLEDDSHSQ